MSTLLALFVMNIAIRRQERRDTRVLRGEALIAELGKLVR